MIRLVLIATSMLAAVPVGMWFALHKPAGAAIWRAVMAVGAVTLASMCMISTSPNLLNLALRIMGILVGVALIGLLRRNDIDRLRPALATLALSDDGMAIPAMDADDIDFLFGGRAGERVREYGC